MKAIESGKRLVEHPQLLIIMHELKDVLYLETIVKRRIYAVVVHVHVYVREVIFLKYRFDN